MNNAWIHIHVNELVLDGLIDSILFILLENISDGCTLLYGLSFIITLYLIRI